MEMIALPGGDDTDDDDDDEESFEDEEDEEEEEEHPALADSSAIPIVDPVPLAGDTEAFEADESAPTARPPQIRIPFAQTRLRSGYERLTDVPEAEMPPQKRACLTTPAPGYEIGESCSGGAKTAAATPEQRTEEFEIRFEEAHDDRAYLGALVNTLYRDRPHHRRTSLAMDREAVYARISWD
ncbi:hypothetical protein Tco_1134191 [Tanacetum coccineum]